MKKNSLLKIVLGIGILSMLFACNLTHTSSIKEPSSTSSSFSLPIVEQDPDAILVESINFKNDSYKVGYGKSISVNPGILPVNAAYRTVYFESSDTEIFKVNSTGYITGVNVGEATLTCYALDGSGVTGSTQIIVFGTEVTSIVISETEKTCGVGEKFTLTTTLNPANATFKELNWESSNEEVARVSESGEVTCVGPGKATIRVSSRSNPAAFAECFISVSYVELKSFHLANRQVYLHVGETFSLIAKFNPYNASYRDIEYSSSDTNVMTVNSNGLITAKKTGVATVKAVTKSKGLTDQIRVEVYAKGDLIKTSMSYSYQDYGANNIYPLSYCPSVGDVKGLVIPIWFTDSNKYIDPDKREIVRKDIEVSFFGSDYETGWKSVKTYYAEESHKRFAFDGTCTEWFECGMASTNFKTDNAQTVKLTHIALEWFSKMHPEEDLTSYDSDGDGSLDAFVMIYAAPDYSASRDWSAQNLWAYCNWTMQEGTFENPRVNGFMWSSFDFMYSRNMSYSKTGYQYGSGDTSRCNVDTHTVVHEFGHLFGLNDYYDYSGQYTAAGDFSMQDHNIGGHDPYSSIALGWADPYIPKKDMIVSINSFEESGDVILLTNQFNNDNSPFDEYILLEYFTPTGVNEFDSVYNNYGVRLNTSGIRVWHIDARLIVGNYYNISNSQIITTNPLTNAGQVTHMLTNTYYKANDAENAARISPLGKDYADYNVLHLIRKDDNLNYRPNTLISNSDLFIKGDTFSVSKYHKQFKNDGLMNTKESLDWEFSVEDMGTNFITLEITQRG